MLVFLYIVLAILILVADIMAIGMSVSAARSKGYDIDGTIIFIGLFTGILGCLMVAALPDLTMQKRQKEMLDVLGLMNRKMDNLAQNIPVTSEVPEIKTTEYELPPL